MEEVDFSHEALVRELGEASPESHRIAAAMCVYRVLPVLERRIGSGATSAVPAGTWSPAMVAGEIFPILEVLRAGLDVGTDEELAEEDEEIEEIFAMTSEMVLRAFAEDFEISRWSDWCSSLCLDVHQAFDALVEEADQEPRFYPAGQYPDLTELQACELEDQVRILRLLRHRSQANDMDVVGIVEAGKARVAASLEQILEGGA
ncbi:MULTISPECIES: hypothetical protein [unclassified Streptomyces]|uniref:hypothetical protein n=1 Tax=unclassified Streptomyces TaxID=2593676 RepID=UPI001319F9CE|nr:MULTISPECIES: hypothetical protein [unclassified Streptomyces]MYY04233.1 hypothetical protein [Streptomyces sp. SID4913]